MKIYKDEQARTVIIDGVGVFALNSLSAVIENDGVLILKSFEAKRGQPKRMAWVAYANLVDENGSSVAQNVNEALAYIQDSITSSVILATIDDVPSALSNLVNDVGFITSDDLPPDAGVSSVNGMAGVVTLGAGDIGLGNVVNVDSTQRSNHQGTQDVSTITGLADVSVSGNYNDLTNTPVIPVVPPRIHIIEQNLRIYCYTNRRWVTFSRSYGPSQFQVNDNAGTGATPSIRWDHVGWFIPAGSIIKRIVFKGRSNAAEVEGLTVGVYQSSANWSDKSSTVDSNGEIDPVQIVSDFDLFNDWLAGDSRDMRMDFKDLEDYEFQQDAELMLFFKPTTSGGVLSRTRYYYINVLIEVEIP